MDTMRMFRCAAAWLKAPGCRSKAGDAVHGSCPTYFRFHFVPVLVGHSKACWKLYVPRNTHACMIRNNICCACRPGPLFWPRRKRRRPPCTRSQPGQALSTWTQLLHA